MVTNQGKSRKPPTFQPRMFLPGFARRLAIYGDLAFVGLSRPRGDDFGMLPLTQRLADADSDAWCGVQVIDLSAGRCVDWFHIDGPVGEIYDVAVLPGVACPMSVGPLSNEAA